MDRPSMSVFYKFTPRVNFEPLDLPGLDIHTQHIQDPVPQIHVFLHMI